MTLHKNPNTVSSRIRAYMRDNPKALPRDIVKALGVKRENVYGVNNYDKLRAKRLRLARKTAEARKTNQIAPPLPITMHDPVNHPEHYKVGGIETIDFIEAKQLSYNLGNVVKYLTRADHKGNRLQDLQKALWYLEREIKNVQG